VWKLVPSNFPGTNLDSTEAIFCFCLCIFYDSIYSSSYIEFEINALLLWGTLHPSSEDTHCLWCKLCIFVEALCEEVNGCKIHFSGMMLSFNICMEFWCVHLRGR
jgi:hypothetical protein